ncbi:MAG: hypothetical protein ACK5LL_14850 [Suipraeoptans sp.]
MREDELIVEYQKKRRAIEEDIEKMEKEQKDMKLLEEDFEEQVRSAYRILEETRDDLASAHSPRSIYEIEDAMLEGIKNSRMDFSQNNDIYKIKKSKLNNELDELQSELKK